jgi:hypothetical protein
MGYTFSLVPGTWYCMYLLHVPTACTWYMILHVPGTWYCTRAYCTRAYCTRAYCTRATKRSWVLGADRNYVTHAFQIKLPSSRKSAFTHKIKHIYPCLHSCTHTQICTQTHTCTTLYSPDSSSIPPTLVACIKWCVAHLSAVYIILEAGQKQEGQGACVCCVYVRAWVCILCVCMCMCVCVSTGKQRNAYNVGK